MAHAVRAKVALGALLLATSAWADVIDDMPIRTWYEVPNSKIRGVLPTPVPPGSSGPDSITEAWNSGAYDSLRDRFLVTGGGHNDYGGNEVYAFRLAAGPGFLAWVRIVGPSPSIPPTGGATCSETYSDGAPAARHTYDTVEFLAGVDRLWVGPGSLYCGSGNSGLATWFLDPATLAWTRRADHPRSELEMVSAYDPVTGHVFTASPASNGFLRRYDPVANTWTTVSGDSVTSHQTATVDPVRRRFVSIGGGVIYSFNLSTGVRSTLSTSGCATLAGASSPGVDYDPVTDRIVGWVSGTSVWSLDLDTNTCTQITPAGSNTVTPSSPWGQGTFGRFRYVPSRNIFIVYNDIDTNVYLYKLTVAGSAPAPPSGLQVAP